MQLVMFSMHPGHRDAQHADDRHDADRDERLQHGVARERLDRNGITLAEARRKPPAVHACDRQHRRHQDELRDEQPAVIARRERRQTADEIKSADRPGTNQGSDTERAERGKSPRRVPGELEPRALSAASRRHK